MEERRKRNKRMMKYIILFLISAVWALTPVLSFSFGGSHNNNFTGAYEIAKRSQSGSQFKSKRLNNFKKHKSMLSSARNNSVSSRDRLSQNSRIQKDIGASRVIKLYKREDMPTKDMNRKDYGFKNDFNRIDHARFEKNKLTPRLNHRFR